MNKKEIVHKHFTFDIVGSWSNNRLVELAEEESGYVGDDGAYGVWYLDQLVDGKRMVQIGYWYNGEESIDITLNEYLRSLKEHLQTSNEAPLVARVDAIIRKNEEKVTPVISVKLTPEEVLSIHFQCSGYKGEGSSANLVANALKKADYSNKDGSYSVRYIKTTEQSNSEFLEIGYWQAGLKYCKVPVKDYLENLSRFLLLRNELELQKQIIKLLEKYK